MNEQQEPDLPRDEHLRAALRHAPDAGVGAPADLGLKIRAAALRAAKVSAAPPSPSPAVPAWPRRLWSWLGQSGRMGASGAFATVLIATVIGLVWRSDAPPEQDQDATVAARPQKSARPATEPAETQSTRGLAELSAENAAALTAAQPAGPKASTNAVRRLSRDGSVASSTIVGSASDPDFAFWLDEAAERSDASELLVELAAFTRGRWLLAAAPPQDSPAVDLPAHGRTDVTLALGDEAVWGCLTTPALRCQRAPITPEQALRLRELLAQKR